METKVKEAEEIGVQELVDEPQTAQPVAVIPAQTQLKQPDFMSLIDRCLTMPDFQLEKLERLLEMQDKIMKKNAEMAFNSALVRLSGDLPRVVRKGAVEYEDKKGGGGKKEAFKFAKYEDIDEVLRPLLAREGFHPSFDTAPRPGDGGGAIITCTLMHVDGHSMKASVPVALDTSGGKNNIQAMGSTISYGQRYCLKMLLNIVTVGEDDDGKNSEKKIISKEDAEKARAMMKETNTEEARFLQYVKSDTVENISPENYEKGIAMLEKKKREMGKPVTEITQQPKKEKEVKNEKA